MARISVPNLGGLKVDLGCGPKCKAGYVGIDFVDHGQAIVWDLRNGIPLPDGSAEKIFTSHFMEHLTRSEGHVIFKEMLRIAAPHSEITIHVPHAETIEAFYIDHYSLWDEKKIVGMVKSWNNLCPWLTITKNEHVGIELQVIIQVRK